MKQLIILITLLSQVFSLKAEFELPFTLGSMSRAEYEVAHSDVDSAFGAVVLFSFTNRYIMQNLTSSSAIRQVKRIKILSKRGVDFFKAEAANFDLKKKDFVVSIYNLEGDQMKTHVVKPTELQNFVTQIKTQSDATLPFLGLGSVIEIDITSFEDLPNTIPLQLSVPCLWSGLRMIHYPGDSVRLIYQGLEKPDEFIENIFYSKLLKEKVIERVMIVKNLDGNFESNIMYNYNLVNEIKSVLLKVETARSKTFLKDFLGKEYVKGFEKDIQFWYKINPYSASDTAHLGEILKSILKPEMSQLEKSKAIHQFVSGNYSFNGKYSWYRSASLKRMDSLKQGNSGDLNRMLYSMHLLAGIQSWPVFIAVRNTPRLNLEFSEMRNENYFLIRVIDSLNGPLVDATSSTLAYDQLPEYVYNYSALQYNPSSLYSFLLNPDSIENTSRRYTEIQVSGKTLQYDCRWIPGIYEQAEFLATPARRDSVLASKGPKQDTATNWTLTSYQWTGLKDQIENPECQFRVVFNEVADRISVNPSAGFPEAFPFPETFRKTAIQFPYAMNNKEAIIIQIPSDYEIEHVPASESFRFEDNNLSFEYSIDTTTPGEIQIRMDHRIRHTFYDAVSYQDIRSYFTEVYKKRSEAVVLRRKKL